MTLRYTVEKLEDVPENLRGLYAPNGNKFTLLVDGAVGKDKLDEFRNNNIQLQQQIDKFKNIDPAKHQELLELQRKLQEEELIDKGEVDKLVNLRVTRMREELETKLNTTSGQLEQANSQLSLLLVDNVVKDAAIKNGVQPTAVDDVILRARGMYKVENGVPVPKNAKGEVVYGEDGKSPMAPDEWVKGLKKTAPHLFQGSSGGGASGGTTVAGTDWTKLSAIEKISMGLKGGLPGESK